jgi:hypothetical protein
MMDWLYRLPEVLVIALTAGLLAAGVIFLPRYVQRVPFLKPTEPGFEFIIRMQAPLFTIAALLLTFTLVDAERNYRQIDASLKAEASQLNQLDRLLVRMNDPAAQAARPLLRSYAKSILEDDWPSMLRRGTGSDKTRLASTALSRAILAIEPEPGREQSIYGEMLKLMEAIGLSRDSRVDSVNVGLPGIYWFVVLFNVTMLLLVSCAIPRTPFRTAVLASQLAVIGAFVGFVFIMDAPYRGETSIQPRAIVKLLATLDERHK